MRINPQNSLFEIGVSRHPRVTPISTAQAPAIPVRADLIDLAKPGIVKMVAITTGVGFALGGVATAWSRENLILIGLACMVGTVLAAAGANVLNQVMEIGRDAAMPRTASRPLPAGRVTPAFAWFFGIALTMLGCAVLAIGAHPVAALVALSTTIIYLAGYTLLKPVSPVSTLVGSVPGALPPLIGWAAAWGGTSGGLDRFAPWTLFLLMFVWQIPHVLAIAWRYRDQYSQGGHLVLPVVDPTGVKTSWAVLAWSLTLIPVSLLPVRAMPGVLSAATLFVATVAGLAMLYSAVQFVIGRTDKDARSLFIASIMYLPVVMLTMVFDAFVIARWLA